jgi:hypothetical protein
MHKKVSFFVFYFTICGLILGIFISDLISSIYLFNETCGADANYCGDGR